MFSRNAATSNSRILEWKVLTVQCDYFLFYAHSYNFGHRLLEQCVIKTSCTCRTVTSASVIHAPASQNSSLLKAYEECLCFFLFHTMLPVRVTRLRCFAWKSCYMPICWRRGNSFAALRTTEKLEAGVSRDCFGVVGLQICWHVCAKARSLLAGCVSVRWAPVSVSVAACTGRHSGGILSQACLYQIYFVLA